MMQPTQAVLTKMVMVRCIIVPTTRNICQSVLYRNAFATHTSITTQLRSYTATPPVYASNNKKKPHQGLIDNCFKYDASDNKATIAVNIEKTGNKDILDDIGLINLKAVENNALVFQAPGNVTNDQIAEVIANILKTHKSAVSVSGDDASRVVTVKTAKDYDERRVADLLAQAFLSFPRTM